jgi:hypothetical protein
MERGMKCVAALRRSPAQHDTTTRGMAAPSVDHSTMRYHCTLVKFYRRLLTNRVLSQSLDPSREKGQVAIISLEHILPQ